MGHAWFGVLMLRRWTRCLATKSLSPLLSSMRKLIDANKGCVCLVQVGSFYELYFEQATLVAPKLGLKVALKRTTNHTVPMAGFPVHQLQKFVKSIVQDLQVNVAIVDQYPSDNQLMHRRVSRIVSPGTLVDELFLNFSQNNYLAAVYLSPNAAQTADADSPVGISWLDILVGDYYVQETTLGDLAAELTRINPSEVVFPKEWLPDGKGLLWLHEWADLRRYFVRYHKTVYSDHKLHFGDPQSVRKKMELLSVREAAAMHLVLLYVHVNLPDRQLLLEFPTQYFSRKYLHMDLRTREALELTGRLGLATGLFLSTIKKTVTPSGTRLITLWLNSPLMDTQELKRRQDYVTFFKSQPLLKTAVRTQLGRMGDFARLLQRLALKSGVPAHNLLAIGEGVLMLDELKNTLSVDNDLMRLFLKDFTVPSNLAHDIVSTLYVTDVEPEQEDAVVEETLEEQLTATRDATYVAKPQQEVLFSVKKDHNPKLAKLHKALETVIKQETSFLDDVRKTVREVDPKAIVTRREQHGRYLNVVHVAFRLRYAADMAVALHESDIKEKRKTTIVFKPELWPLLLNRRVKLEEDIEEEERAIIGQLRDKVLAEIGNIRKVNRMADFLDVITAFATLAEENNWVCPKFVKTPQLSIVEGRHLVVEASLKANGEMFQTNDTRLGHDGALWVISGPNMGGKSTFLRQNALIVILAQMGLFVPASKATLGVVDRIFTRIGASDDLYSDLSTFMVEMVETSNILKNATPRLLAVVDEIGRGTSGREGLAIAYATLVALLCTNRCRTLFATHFGHELKALLDKDKINQKNMRYFQTRVEADGPLVFDHRLRPGISERSHAFEVAKMAGFPEPALRVAARALKLISE